MVHQPILRLSVSIDEPFKRDLDGADGSRDWHGQTAHESREPQEKQASSRHDVLPMYDRLPFGRFQASFWPKRSRVNRILFSGGTGAKPSELAEAEDRGGDDGAGNAHPQELAPDYIESAGAEE
jgi:hypothetical protein